MIKYKDGNWHIEHHTYFSGGIKTDAINVIHTSDTGITTSYHVSPKIKLGANDNILDSTNEYSEEDYREMLEGVKKLA